MTTKQARSKRSHTKPEPSAHGWSDAEMATFVTLAGTTPTGTPLMVAAAAARGNAKAQEWVSERVAGEPPGLDALRTDLEPFLVREFLAAHRHPLTALEGNMEEFPDDAGIYALYLGGARYPIYIGKSDVSTRRRLTKHRQKLGEYRNPQADDMHFVVATTKPWSALPFEQAAIALFTPAWNKFLPGFGRNQPGSGREGVKASLWEYFHGDDAGEATVTREELAAKLDAHRRQLARLTLNVRALAQR